MDCKINLPKKQLAIIIITLITALMLGAIIGYFFNNSAQPTSKRYSKVLALPEKSNPNTLKHNKTHTQTFIIAPGETLTSIFHRANLPKSLLAQIMKLPHTQKTLSQIQPWQKIIITTQQHKFKMLTYKMNDEKSLTITKHHNTLTPKYITQPETETLQYKSATINHSLAEAAYRAKLTPHLSNELKTMFAGKINFSRDIHPGDKFKILYKEYYINGKKERPGDIVAAELDTNHHHYHVIRFKEPDHRAGYYTPDGHAISSLFLKVPLVYKRISSYFNYHRFDPVLHKIHPHLGIDLAAPRGTPVKAIGHGKIVLRGWVRGYGNTVIIQYNKTYRTLYGHMEKFAKGLKAHQYVKKGQIVGFVGSTGWSTGPHLHFEIYKHGKPVNPLKLHFPHSPPLPHKYHHVFSTKAQHLLDEMKLFEQTKNAMTAATKLKA